MSTIGQSATFRRASGWLPAIELDPELNQRRTSPEPTSQRRLAARVLHLSPGPFEARDIAPHPDGWLGLLVVDGLLLVEGCLGHGPVGWMLGEDDLLRPWEMEGIPLTLSTSWRALTPARLALLDEEFGRRTGGAPIITRALLGRASRTTRWLLATSMISSAPVVEERLLLLFALLGERWGKATPEGISVDLPLTHRLLASLVGARRPSVSTALGALASEGVICRRPGHGWLLRRTISEDQTRPRAWDQYASALGIA